ncbi:MAG: IPTL-CTERM sorting domain-containing protein, partial [Ottowia sp.]|nr:IPTL-CTERM sorting domain-containing protein [Ottowia sp.]
DPTPTPSGGGNSSSPTMGELGLLLSGLALAGAAAPALRRREKRGKKADTRQ